MPETGEACGEMEKGDIGQTTTVVQTCHVQVQIYIHIYMHVSICMHGVRRPITSDVRIHIFRHAYILARVHLLFATIYAHV